MNPNQSYISRNSSDQKQDDTRPSRGLRYHAESQAPKTALMDFFSQNYGKRNIYINLMKKKKVARNGFEPLVYGLWARRDFLTTPPV